MIDHFFVVYPADSCAVVGWDYRELEGPTTAEAEEVFAQGMQEFASFLKDAKADWPLEPSVGLCGSNHSTN